jgi:hypothetical protein
MQPQHGHHLRERGSIQYNTPFGGRTGYPRNGVLPTPDPTVASCISDEDVARTLIALGDASNYSNGRTSNSTMDETFSGVADAASSTGATSDSDEYSEDEEAVPKHHTYLNEEDDEYDHEGLIKSEYDDFEGAPKTKKIKTKLYDGPSTIIQPKSNGVNRGNKLGKVKHTKSNKSSGLLGQNKMVGGPLPPPQPRKTSSSSSVNLTNTGAIDDDDLSSKPRCQRCRKSKKGCDRQRPCQRCKDAGIGIEGCISEDEGNGRKGRYGRHMGVSLKKGDSVRDEEESLMLPPVSIMASPDNSKKRKR